MFFSFSRALLYFSFITCVVICTVVCFRPAAAGGDPILKELFGIQPDQSKGMLDPDQIDTHYKLMVIGDSAADEITVQAFLVIVNLHDRPGVYRHYLGMKIPPGNLQITKSPAPVTIDTDQRGVYLETNVKKGTNAIQWLLRLDVSDVEVADLTLTNQTLAGLQVFHDHHKTTVVFPSGQRIFQDGYSRSVRGYEDRFFPKGEIITLKVGLVKEETGLLSRLKKTINRIMLKIHIAYLEATDTF